MRKDILRITLFLFTFLAVCTAQAEEVTVDNIRYELDDEAGTATVIDGNSATSPIVTIPEQVVYNDKSYAVTAIGANAFYSNSRLSGIYLPDGITSIGEAAFCKCERLHDITLPASLVSIGDYAFFGCQYYLNRITFPEGVETIGKYAFCNCQTLNYVVLPPKLESLPLGVFANCSLRSVTLPQGLTQIADDAFGRDMTFRSTTVMEHIYSYAPSPLSIGQVVWSDYVCSVCTLHVSPGCGDTYRNDPVWGRFRHIEEDLAPLGIQDNIYYALDETNRTATVTTSGIHPTHLALPEQITHEGTDYAVTAIGPEAFSGHTGLESVLLPQGLTSIGDQAFYGCNKLTAAELPEDLVSIGDLAFYGCPLTNVILPKELAHIGRNAFSNLSEYVVADGNQHFCTVDGILFSMDRTELVAYPTMKDGTQYTVPDGVTSIANGALAWNSLTDITLPQEGLTRIGDHAFGGSEITGIALPASLTHIGEYAFLNSSINSITLPQSLSHIGRSAFRYSQLAEFIVAEGNPHFRVVDGVLFSADLASLVAYPCNKNEKSYTMPDEVERVEDDAFHSCQMDEINTSKSLTSIGESAFESNNLASITLPEGVTEIGSNAFRSCYGLTDIFSYAKEPASVDWTVWRDLYSCSLHVTAGAGDAYRNADFWRYFSNIMEDLDTGIGQTAADGEETVGLTGKGIALGDAPWTVYTTDGRMVANGQKAATLRLPAGTYIVRCGKTVKKLAVD